MAGTDYINALGAGASFDTKKIVEALVNAERAPQQARIEKSIANSEATISGLGKAVSVMNVLSTAAERLNDASDFKTYGVSNSQKEAFSATTTSSARTGSNSITVSQIAREQRSVSGAFASTSASLNSGSAITLSMVIGASSTTTTSIVVNEPTLQSTVNAINNANLGVTAEIVDTGGTGNNYRIQLIGATGAEKAFSLTSDESSLSFSSVQSATDANISLNGIDFTRSTNVIDDVLTGVTLTLNGTTTGAASLAINQDNTVARANIVDFVTIYNEAKRQLDELSSSSVDGPLAGDSIFRSMTRQLRNIMLNTSSTPGANLRTMSDMGISVNKVGQMEVNDNKLDAALADNFADVVKIFSANTDDQSLRDGTSAGIAGDLAKLIADVTDSSAYLSTQQASLKAKNADYAIDLTELEEKMTKVEARYTSQFLAMQRIIEEMNSTSESMKSSFENLPFSNKD
ncbi:flagellar filament capping protein FliD [Pseudomonadales bacterium]|nr:flagellar filament capping protein FliD [Pseudomonadales bacterium]